MGFKCCRCRRARIPICPYLDPKSKRQLEEKRICSRASKKDSRGMEPDSCFISELQKDEEMTIPVVPLEGTTSLEDNNPLVSVEEFTEHSPGGGCEKSAATLSLPGPRKQPVRDDSSATLTKNVKTSSRFLPDKNADTSYVKHEPAISTISAAIAVPCKMCSHAKPCPDLCCDTCEMWIHRHCSPWNEEEPGEDCWKCGNCREWR